MTFHACFEVSSKRWSGRSKVDHKTSNSIKKWLRDTDLRRKPELSHTVQDHLTWSTWAWYLCFFRSTSHEHCISRGWWTQGDCPQRRVSQDPLYLASSIYDWWVLKVAPPHLYSLRAGRWSLLSAPRGRFRLLTSAAPDPLHHMMIRRWSNKSIYIYIYREI